MNTKSIITTSNNWLELKEKLKALSKKEMGNVFELLTKLYFTIQPKYAFYDAVWLLNEVPSSVLEYLEIPSHDLGIDLIAQWGDEFHAIQCKYHSDYNTSVNFKEVATFISLLEGNSKFTQGYICSTADSTSRNLDKVKTKHINHILSDSWQELDEDFFDKVRNYFDNKNYKPIAYIPKEHQVKALNDCVTYFNNPENSKGKLIFPCGAGKSLTGFWITQELKSTSTIIAVPSLSLVKQTLDVYLREIVARGIAVEWLCICSDEGIGKDDEILEKTESIGVPCETNPIYIENWLLKNKGKHTIIFTTYQSGKIIADVSKKVNFKFDLGIFDEAHKTVGLNKKLFSYLLFDENISIAKKIFMTATERFYSGTKEDIISMDDTDIYGDTFSQMSFKEAIEKELLTDYKVITIDVKKSEIAEFIKSNNLVQLNNKWKNETEARSLASMIALRKAMKVLPIKNAVSFHSSIEKAERNKELQNYITNTYQYDAINSYTVSSKVPTTRRNILVQEFANSSIKALITNSKCLTEGVDVPNIDCIVFADPRKSKVDIVQALGRALRKKEGKEWGYVILPVIYDDETHEIDNENYAEIISIIRGLASNDERIVEYFKEKGDTTGTKRVEGSSLFDFNFSSELLDEKDLTAQLQIKIWENLSKFQWMPFEEAREFVWGLKLNYQKDWNLYCSSGRKPGNLPSNPDKAYKENGWLSMQDWLGTEIGFNGYAYLPYDEAKQFIKALNISSQSDWSIYLKSGERPKNIPSSPGKYYKDNGWTTWGDWLGSNRIADQYKKYRTFEDAKKYVIKLGIKSQKEWNVYAKARGEKPDDIPYKPQRTYQSEWISWGDWLGTNRIADNKKEHCAFIEARNFARNLNLLSSSQWSEFCKSGNKPNNIPTDPRKVYRNEFVNMQDFLGYNEILKYQGNKENWLTYEEAQKIIKPLQIKSGKEFKEFRKNKRFDKNIIPSKPDIIYKTKGWKGWADFLGKE
jgi:superfamily II DNA or RNA helicase